MRPSNSRIFLAFGDDGANAGGSEEGGNAGSTGANPFGKRALRDEFEIEFAGEHEFLEVAILADVAALVALDLSLAEEAAESEVVDAHVVADGVEILDAFADEGVDKIFGDAAKSKAADD